MTPLCIFYRQFTSRVTSFSKNEMNIQIPFCNIFRHLNGILRNLSKKDALAEQKNSKYCTGGMIFSFETRNAVMNR